MKYIKGVNMNFDDKAYLKSHFEEEEQNMEQQILKDGSKPEAVEEPEEDLPDEFVGVKPEMIERNIRRLELDMQAEIETIKARYTGKISHLQNVLRIANKKHARENSAIRSQQS